MLKQVIFSKFYIIKVEEYTAVLENRIDLDSIELHFEHHGIK